jgi:hypothetical protein
MAFGIWFYIFISFSIGQLQWGLSMSNAKNSRVFLCVCLALARQETLFFFQFFE